MPNHSYYWGAKIIRQPPLRDDHQRHEYKQAPKNPQHLSGGEWARTLARSHQYKIAESQDADRDGPQ